MGYYENPVLGRKLRSLCRVVPFILTDGTIWIPGLMKTKGLASDEWTCFLCDPHVIEIKQMPESPDLIHSLAQLEQDKRGLPALEAFQSDEVDAKNIEEGGFLTLLKVLVCWVRHPSLLVFASTTAHRIPTFRFALIVTNCCRSWSGLGSLNDEGRTKWILSSP